ncbi:MAG: GNAT family N-acetyltransferase, partial [Opitutaceae bacterium]
MIKSLPAASNRIARHKLALLQQAGLFGNDTKGATIRRAYTAHDLGQAYRLVHDVYLGTGYTRPEPSGIRLRMYETMSETATFIAEKDGVVVGVLSVVGDSLDLGLPSDSAFEAELNGLRAPGVRICELTNQAVADEYRKSAVPTELMRCALAHAMRAGYHESVATVSPGHKGFYKLVGFRPFGSPRSYSQKLNDPVVAL